MKLERIVTELGLRTIAAPAEATALEISRGYASDLLSDVLAHAPREASS